jgi:F0F1-type ATP synthase membrane subunit a
MGVFVAVVQAVVFSLLSTVYIGQAVAHEEH